MVARVTTYENVDLALADGLGRWFASLDEDPFKTLPGYGGSLTLVDRDNARLIGIGFYASAGDAGEVEARMGELAAQAAEAMPPELLPALAMQADSVGVYEVAQSDLGAGVGA